MAYNDNTTKRKRFKYLSQEERGAIEKLLEAGFGIREIARRDLSRILCFQFIT